LPFFRAIGKLVDFFSTFSVENFLCMSFSTAGFPQFRPVLGISRPFSEENYVDYVGKMHENMHT
jgi:hypothetical protein